MLAGGPTFVRLKVADGRAPRLAVIVYAPAIPLAVAVTMAIPEEFVCVGDPRLADCPEPPATAANTTVWLATGRPFASITNAASGAAKAVLVRASWLFPEYTYTCAAAPAAGASLNVTVTGLLPLPAAPMTTVHVEEVNELHPVQAPTVAPGLVGTAVRMTVLLGPKTVAGTEVQPAAQLMMAGFDVTVPKSPVFVSVRVGSVVLFV